MNIKPNQINDIGYFIPEDDWIKIVTAIGALDALADLMDETGNRLSNAVGLPVDNLKQAADKAMVLNPF